MLYINCNIITSLLYTHISTKKWNSLTETITTHSAYKTLLCHSIPILQNQFTAQLPRIALFYNCEHYLEHYCCDRLKYIRVELLRSQRTKKTHPHRIEKLCDWLGRIKGPVINLRIMAGFEMVLKMYLPGTHKFGAFGVHLVTGGVTDRVPGCGYEKRISYIHELWEESFRPATACKARKLRLYVLAAVRGHLYRCELENGNM